LFHLAQAAKVAPFAAGNEALSEKRPQAVFLID
jgi:hypothetical protein